MDQQLRSLESALGKVQEVEELLHDNAHQAMMHRHLSHVKHELRRQITILTTEELDVLKETIQSEV
jgi:hypothetical protein